MNWLRALRRTAATPVPTAEAAAGGSTQPDVDEVTLDTLTHLPAVAVELAAAPAVWRNCSYRDIEENPDDLDVPLEELLGYVYLDAQDGVWTLAVADEVKPVLDLDADEDTDPIVATLLADPRVADAYHEDREVYRAEVTAALTLEDAAALVVRALVAGHRHALQGAGLTD